MNSINDVQTNKNSHTQTPRIAMIVWLIAYLYGVFVSFIYVEFLVSIDLRKENNLILKGENEREDNKNTHTHTHLIQTLD